MAKCMACGKSKFFKTYFFRAGSIESWAPSLDKITLCKKCGEVLELSKWRKRDCASLDELTKMKTNSLKIAAEHNMPKELEVEISRYFDEYICKGYDGTFDGKLGQTIKIFSETCLIMNRGGGNSAKLREIVTQLPGFDVVDLYGQYDTDHGNIEENARAWREQVDNMTEKQREELRKSLVEYKINSIVSSLDYGHVDAYVYLKRFKAVEVVKVKKQNYGCLRFLPKDEKADSVGNAKYFLYKKSMEDSIQTVVDKINRNISMLNAKN